MNLEARAEQASDRGSPVASSSSYPAVSRAAARLAFAGAAAVSIYGFLDNRLLDQVIWDPPGIRRLAWFSIAFAGWWAAAGLWNAGRFLRLTAALAAAYAAASAGLGAVCAVALFLAASAAAGGLALRRLPPSGSGIEDALLRLVAGVAIFSCVAGWIVRFPVNYPAVYLALLLLPLLANGRSLPALARPLFRAGAAGDPLTRKDLPSLGALLMVLTAHLLVALKPETSADGLAMHLAAPAYVEHFRRWPFDVTQFIWAVMPMGADWCFTVAYILGGEAAAKLLNYTMALAAAGLLYCMCRRLAPRPAALLLAALWASTPLVQLVTGCLMVENVWTAFSLAAAAAVFRYRENGKPGFVLLAAFLCGAGIAVKFGGLAFALPVAMLAARRLWRTTRIALAAAALLLAAGASPYVTAWLKTGNPVFPFANHLFRSPYFDASPEPIDPRFRLPITPAILYDLTFRTHRYFEGQNGSLGFHYLILLPVAAAVSLACRPSLRAASAAAFLAAVFSALTFRQQSNLRYLYPVLPLCLVAAAPALRAVRESDPSLSRALHAAMGVVWAANLYFLASSSWYHKEFFLDTLFDRGDVEAYLETGAPGRAVAAYLNLKHLPGAVAFLEMDQVAGYHGVALSNGWHHDRFARRLGEGTTAEDCRRAAREFNVQYFIAPLPDSGIPLRQPCLAPFLSRYTVNEFQSGQYYAARVRSDAEIAADSARVVSQDDASPAVRYAGPWIHARFPEASGATVSYSDVPGAAFQLEFQGSEIVYGYTRAFNRGKARITIDGIDKGILDQYSSAVQWRTPLVLGGLSPGPHRLEVLVLAERNPRSSGGFVDVDYFETR